MRYSTAFFRATLFLMPAVLVLSLSAGEDEDPKLHFEVSRYNSGWVTSDTNGDGRVDYAVKLDERLRKVAEAMDFSHNGFMDNFYFYENDVLVRHELDTNGDQRVDLWVHMYRGVHVRAWERDTNHDGVADLYRSYE